MKNSNIKIKATGKALDITDSDGLTVGGLIVPQNVIINVPLDATSVDRTVFIADAAYKLVSCNVVISVQGGSGATVEPKKLTGTQAIGAGVSMLTAVFNVNTMVVETVTAGTLSTTSTNYTLAAGNRIGLDFSGTLTNLVGCMTLVLKRV